jgi:hypothetical protein
VMLKPSCFLSVMWRGEVFYRLGVQGFRVLFLLSVFFFFLSSVAPAGNYSVWSVEGLPSIFGAGSWQAGGQAVAAWQTGRGWPGRAVA